MDSVFTPPGDCPVCGEPVPRGALSCPGCGADERTGWNEDAAIYDGLDLPEAADQDEHSTAAESAGAGRKPRTDRIWPGLAVIVIGILAIFFALRFLQPHG